jgi:hypothetical protein
VAETLRCLADAGIRTIMVTGDHPETAPATFLVVWVYVPTLGMSPNLSVVPVLTLLAVSAAVVAWIALLEVWKALRGGA